MISKTTETRKENGERKWASTFQSQLSTCTAAAEKEQSHLFTTPLAFLDVLGFGRESRNWVQLDKRAGSPPPINQKAFKTGVYEICIKYKKKKKDRMK